MHQIADLITETTDPEQIFELLDILGQGSYGSVFKALHKQTGQLYAIKILPATSGVEISAIKKEIGVLKQCNDDHIVRYFGSYYKDGNLWIIMEYCVAGSVTDIMQITKKKLNESEIASIIESALKGLHYIHSKKKIHRDIKAANILLDQKGFAKLADFGVSASSIYTNDRFKTHIGSPYWMSPEIIRYTEYNHKTDIWSLGITTIELAEGQVPNSHIKPFMVIFMTKSNPVQGFTNPNLWSPQLKDFVKLCLQINPQSRPQAKQLLEHQFIKKNSKGQRLLQQLVLSSLEEIQQFRMNQSRNSSFAEIIVDEGKGDTKTIVERSREYNKKEGSGSCNSGNLYEEGGSMVIISSRRSNSETGSMIINGSMVINEGEQEKKNDNNNVLSEYINELKGFSNTQMQYEQMKNLLISEINNLDRRCQEELEATFQKYKQMFTQKLSQLVQIFNPQIEEKQLYELYSSKLQNSTDLLQFLKPNISQRQSKSLVLETQSRNNGQKNSFQNSISTEFQKIPHNPLQNKIVQEIMMQHRKQTQSFTKIHDRTFQKKSYLEREIPMNQAQEKSYPSHNSSRILFKNPNNETPNSLPKKIQQFKEDPDVLEYLQKTFGSQNQTIAKSTKEKVGNHGKSVNGIGSKVHTEMCIKQQKSTEHSVSKGKNIRSSKNIKHKKSKNKVK